MVSALRSWRARPALNTLSTHPSDRRRTSAGTRSKKLFVTFSASRCAFLQSAGI